MKKRPSLLDVEVFAKKRADSRLDKLKRIEKETFKATENTFENVDEENAPTSYAQEHGQHKEQVPDSFMDELAEKRKRVYHHVIRLFRAECFQTPAPHKTWNEKIIEQLYAEAKRTIY